MNPAETLFALAKAAAPGATVRVSHQVEGGGNVITTTLFTVVLTGPDIIGEVTSTGHSPEAAAASLKRDWMAARRRRDIDVLYRECVSRADAEYDPDELAHWQTRLGKLYYPAYLAEAARLKSQATQQHSLAA